MSGWTRLATVTANTKRAEVSAGKRGAPVDYLFDLQCTPLQPAGIDLLQRYKLDTPHQVFETFVAGLADIRTGDVLSVDGRDYTIRARGAWNGVAALSSYAQLLVEDVQA